LDIASQLGGTFGFYNDSTNTNTPSTMYLPAVASNLATKYESWVVATVRNMKYVDF
jgi:hypothetical protein